MSVSLEENDRGSGMCYMHSSNSGQTKKEELALARGRHVIQYTWRDAWVSMTVIESLHLHRHHYQQSLMIGRPFSSSSSCSSSSSPANGLKNVSNFTVFPSLITSVLSHCTLFFKLRSRFSSADYLIQGVACVHEGFNLCLDCSYRCCCSICSIFTTSDLDAFEVTFPSGSF